MTDTIKMLTYRAETALVRSRESHYPKTEEDGRALVREILLSSADIIPEPVTQRLSSQQELSYLGIQEAVNGAVRAEVGVELEVVDLRSGDHLAAVTGKGSGFAMDRIQGFQKAKHAPVIGDVLSDIVLHGRSKDYDLSAFRWSRFRDGDLLPQASWTAPPHEELISPASSSA